MAGSPVVFLRQSPLNGGTVQPGAQCFVYDATLTAKHTLYTTSAMSVQLSNPVIADANGRFPAIWVNPAAGAYKVVIAPAADSDPPASPFWTDDNIPPDVSLSVANAFTAAQTVTVPSGTANFDLRATGANRLKLYGDTGGVAFINARINSDASDAPLQIQASTLALVATTATVNGNSAATIIEGSFTGTLTGMSGATTGTVSYRIVANSAGTGKLCRLFLASAITGTSNTTALTMTGLPAAATPVGAVVVLCHVTENGTDQLGQATISAAGTTITFYTDLPFSATGFTNSGTKGLPAGWQIEYAL